MTTAKIKSIRSQIRANVLEAIETEDFVRLPDLAAKAQRLFLDDPGLREELANEVLPGVILDIVQRTVAETRKINKEVIATQSGVITSADAIRKAAKAHNVFGDWMERVETEGKHVRLMKMTKGQLLGAAQERAGNAAYNTGLSKTWTELAEGLEEGQAVEDVFTDEDIAKVYGKHGL